MDIVFYDRTGAAVAYSDDRENIFSFNGEAVAYLDADAIYSFRGVLLGWLENGWLRDRDGRCVAFTDHAVGGPQRPWKKAIPTALPQQSLPAKEQKDPRTLRPVHSNAWSTLSAEAFFLHLPRRWPGGLGESAAANER